MASVCGRSCNSLKSINTLYPLSVRLSNSKISVRWRKPRWIPKTQSKVFYVRKPTPRDEDETKLMKEKYAIYRTEMKAIRSFFTTVVQEEKEARREYRSSVEVEKELAKFRMAMDINKCWNEESANLRIKREEAEAKEDARLKAIEDQKQKKRDDQLMAQLQSRIDENIKSLDKFITPENMDEEIEKVLDSRVDFNFPINKKGQIDKKNITQEEDTSTEPNENM